MNEEHPLGNVKIVAMTDREGYHVEVEIKKMVIRFIKDDLDLSDVSLNPHGSSDDSEFTTKDEET